jgi:hypothetical protein
MSKQPIIKPWFSPSNYDAVRREAEDDLGLPGTYIEWLDLATKEIAELEARGRTVIKVVVVPDQFARYCEACGQKQNAAMLAAFVAEKSLE